MSLFPKPDIHSHDKQRVDDAVINISPFEDIIPGAVHSVGIHPWLAHEATHDTLQRLALMCAHRQIVAIGETGLDALRGGDISKQTEIFIKHIALSEEYRKPLIIHAVKTYSGIITLHRDLHPTQPWIIHGFRGKPQLAIELLRHGLYISLGEKFNPDTAAIIPDDRLFFESDESPLPISQIIYRITRSRTQ